METDFETIGEDQYENETGEESLDEDVQCETKTESDWESEVKVRITGNMDHKNIMRHEKFTKSLTITHNILRYFDDFLDNQ